MSFLNRTLLIAGFFMMISASLAFSAQDDQINQWSHSPTYAVKTGGMLVDGARSVAFSPFELLYHPLDEVAHSKQNYLFGLFDGLGYGAYRAVEKMGIGTWNILSAFWPSYNGIEQAHYH